MKKILLLSDTHSYIDEAILGYAKNADEVWHCGDFGNQEVIKSLQSVALLRGVFGNIDGAEIRSEFAETNYFWCEEVSVLMLHIGGYPDKYTALAKKEISEKKPRIFISGHSHILKVMHDKKNGLLHLNPGAVGKYGWQKVRTMLRFEIDKKEIRNLEIIEFKL